MSHRNETRAMPNGTAALGLLAAFTTALLWWIGIVGVIATGGGSALFLTIPILATIGTCLISKPRRRWTTQTLQSRHKHKSAAPSSTLSSVIVLAAFSSALLWWIGIAGLISTQGIGALVFLTVPVLTTTWTLAAVLRHGRKTSHPST